VRDGQSHYQKHAGTPPMHLMFALGQAPDILFAEGLDNAFRRHHLLAEAVRHAIAVWKEGNVIDFNIVEPAERSDTVTTVLMADGFSPNLLREYCDSRYALPENVSGCAPIARR
jgi:alanine-glyoxylate transaminase / serine-glyoxylate transaminase / serine-pyruvate transaminase